MPRCAVCGQDNRTEARFCYNCATPLTLTRPTDDDHQWLVANLTRDALSQSMPTTRTLSSVVSSAEEERMEQPASRLFAGRYELREGRGVPLMVIDTQPWRRCWACGAETNQPDDGFCNDCGAALTQREYQGVLTAREATVGAALINRISDPDLISLLPTLTQVEDGGAILTLLHDSGRGSIALPVDEIAALTIGMRLAKLLAHLHGLGLALGALTPADLESAPGTVRLRAVPNLRALATTEYDTAIREDLYALAELLEQLTATPRTTRRLSEEEAAQTTTTNEAGLPAVLRQIRVGDLDQAEAVALRFAAILADRTSPLPLRQMVGACSDTGVVRDHNEDSYLTVQLGLDNNGQRHAWGLYIVSDGMGGHAAGEVASGLAVRAAAELLMAEYLTHAIQPNTAYDEPAVKAIVQRAVLRANEAVVAESRNQGNDMGATFTLALVVGDRVVVGNVGDSRAYLYRDAKLRRISKDHSLVQRLVDLGQISPDEAYTHPQRNAVLRSLGDRAELLVDTFSERLHPGDALLLCSDGQWEMTRDPTMEQLIAQAADAQTACHALVAAANQAGGEDNITVVLVQFA